MLAVTGLFNLLYAEVSYIIDIACHWTFFPILLVLAPIFFHFPTPDFCRTLPSNLCSPMSGIDYSALVCAIVLMCHEHLMSSMGGGRGVRGVGGGLQSVKIISLILSSRSLGGAKTGDP